MCPWKRIFEGNAVKGECRFSELMKMSRNYILVGQWEKNKLCSE